MKKHYRLRITGKVQGVWYRASTQKKAQELGVNGWVANRPDRSVYAEIEGEIQACQALIDWCWQGPELAEVDQVEVTEGEVQGFDGFRVER